MMIFYKFKEIYRLLNYNNRCIVYQTLLRMKPQKTADSELGKKIHGKIKQEYEKQSIGYNALYKKMNKLENDSLLESTYKSFMHRKSPNPSILLYLACKILNINKEITQMRFLHSASQKQDIGWLYKSLSKQNRHAVYYLAYALYVAENNPDVFKEMPFNAPDLKEEIYVTKKYRESHSIPYDDSSVYQYFSSIKSAASFR